MDVVPVLVRVSVSDELLPRTRLPKLRLAGDAVNAPGATPVPESGNVSEGFDAFDVMVTVPVALPAVCGAKPTLNVVLCEGFSVSGVVMPLRVNPVPLTAACEMLTAVPPLFVRVTLADWVAPTAMLPNDSLVGFSDSCPAATPVPERGMLRVGFEAFDVTVSVPLTAPVAVGSKLTLKDALCPAPSVRGVVIPLILNSVRLDET